MTAMYALRIPIVIAFVAAAARLLLDLPRLDVFVLAGVAVALIAAERVRVAILNRRAAGSFNASAETWIDCEAEKELPGPTPGLWVTCHDRKGHDGPHTSSIEARW